MEPPRLAGAVRAAVRRTPAQAAVAILRAAPRAAAVARMEAVEDPTGADIRIASIDTVYGS